MKLSSFSPSIIKGGLDEENLNNSKDTEIPVLGNIAAGMPIEAIENFENYIDFPSSNLKESIYYALKVKGDSMIDSGIYEDDLIIIDSNKTPNNGDIVVALIDEEDVLSHVYKNEQLFTDQIEKVMVTDLETLDVQDTEDSLCEILSRGRVAILYRGETFLGFVTKVDLINRYKSIFASV